MKHRLIRLAIPLLFAAACIVGLSVGLRAVAQGHGEAVRIELMPEEATIIPGESITYTVTAYDMEENAWDVTPDSNFSTEAWVGGSWTGNEFTAQHWGAFTITAVYQDLTDTVTLIVVYP